MFVWEINKVYTFFIFCVLFAYIALLSLFIWFVVLIGIGISIFCCIRELRRRKSDEEYNGSQLQHNRGQSSLSKKHHFKQKSSNNFEFAKEILTQQWQHHRSQSRPKPKSKGINAQVLNSPVIEIMSSFDTTEDQSCSAIGALNLHTQVQLQSNTIDDLQLALDQTEMFRKWLW